MTFLIAGHETTAVALTYAWYLLATHPGVEQRLIGELATVLDGDSPSMTEVSELTFTDHVITETMRLFPPANRIHREPVEDVVIRKYQIPAGATIVLPQWVVHRDPRWYRDPPAFYPERWIDEFRTQLPRLAYFPFGAGPRRCIGDRFARLEATLVLATILQQYHLELPPETSLQV
jgi:cytochrome P450